MVDDSLILPVRDSLSSAVRHAIAVIIIDVIALIDEALLLSLCNRVNPVCFNGFHSILPFLPYRLTIEPVVALILMPGTL